MHYLWCYTKFDFSDLKTTKGEKITIINPGQYLQVAGPDFFNAQITMANQKWAGNIEIHVQSSDWYLHHHENDDNYNNVILHVVWHHDTPVFRKDNSELPVLELKNYVSKDDINKYQKLFTPKSWIFCEKQIAAVDKLNTNGATFFKMAKSIPFSVIRKEAMNVASLEALLFGQMNMIPIAVEDAYLKELQLQYKYMKIKYQLQQPVMEPGQFFKHRPDNFPTIRLSQLSMLYHLQRNLFSTISNVNSVKEIYQIFHISANLSKWSANSA